MRLEPLVIIKFKFIKRNLILKAELIIMLSQSIWIIVLTTKMNFMSFEKPAKQNTHKSTFLNSTLDCFPSNLGIRYRFSLIIKKLVM